MSKTLDEILAKHNDELDATREYPDTVTPDTKQAILRWVSDEVIGEDISLPKSIMPMHAQTVINIEKRKQRAIIK